MTNLPPSIAGSPPGSVAANEMYDFVPSASDPNGDVLGFSITNKPTWAGFTEETGELQGVPGEEHIGVQGPITVTVHDPYGESASLQFTIEVTPGSNIDRLGAMQGAFFLLLNK